MKLVNIVSLLITALIVITGFNNCSGVDSTTAGNPLVHVKLESFTTSISSLSMCFKRLRFKPTAGSADQDNVDLDLGELMVDDGGTNISSVHVPAGTYQRIEFDLEDDCATNRSLMVTNGNGTFSTDDGINIRFDGNFTVAAEGEYDLMLNIQDIVTALQGVSNDSQIRSAAESVGGTF